MNYKNILNIMKFIGISIVLECLFNCIGSNFLINYLKNNLIGILLTLLAINTATSTFIVSKLEEISNSYKINFSETYSQIKLSLIEQIFLLILSIGAQTVFASEIIKPYSGKLLNYTFDVIMIFSFIYAIEILRDTGIAMFEILVEKGKIDENN